MQLYNRIKLAATQTLSKQIYIKECASFSYINKKDIISLYDFLIPKYLLSLEYLFNDFNINVLNDGVPIEQEIHSIKKITDIDKKGFRKFGIFKSPKEKLMGQNLLKLHRLQYWINPKLNKNQIQYLDFFKQVTKHDIWKNVDIEEIKKQISEHEHLIYDTSFMVKNGIN